MHARLYPAAEGGEVALHHRDIVHDELGMIAQAFAGRGELDAPTATPHERDTEIGFEALDPGARGCKSKVGPFGAMGNAAAVCYSDKELKIHQIEMHGQAPG